MKKSILILVAIVTFFSCSKEEKKLQSNKQFINPPSWIIGKWLDKSGKSWSRTGGFEFTNDNIFDLDAKGEVTRDFKKSFSESVRAKVLSVKEKKTDNSYVFEVWTSDRGTKNLSYKFVKKSSSVIIYELNDTYNIELTKIE